MPTFSNSPNVTIISGTVYNIDLEQVYGIMRDTDDICRIYDSRGLRIDNSIALKILEFCDYNINNCQGFLFEYTVFWYQNGIPTNYGYKEFFEHLFFILKKNRGNLTFEQWLNKTTIER